MLPFKIITTSPGSNEFMHPEADKMPDEVFIITPLFTFHSNGQTGNNYFYNEEKH